MGNTVEMAGGDTNTNFCLAAPIAVKDCANF